MKSFCFKLFAAEFIVGTLCVGVVCAQSGNSDRCEVIAIDVSGKKPSRWDRLAARRLGIFDTTIAEEELTTRIYPASQNQPIRHRERVVHRRIYGIQTGRRLNFYATLCLNDTEARPSKIFGVL